MMIFGPDIFGLQTSTELDLVKINWSIRKTNKLKYAKDIIDEYQEIFDNKWLISLHKTKMETVGIH